MKRWFRISVSVMIVLAACSSAVFGEQTLEGLNKALADVMTWKHGNKGDSLRTVESIVFGAVKDPKLRGVVEERLVATLKSSTAPDGRRFLCRQLRTIGTGKSVPALAALLGDAELSHAARYALGRIEDASAVAALHKALGKTSGKLQAGIITTLSKRGYSKALGDFVKLFGSSDATVAEAAVRGVGRLGGADAVKALQAARSKASGAIRKRMTDALMECAEQFVRGGKSDAAAKIYRGLYSSKEPVHVRLGALGGLSKTQDPKAAPLIADAVKSDNPQIRASAIAFMTTMKGADATKVLISMLGSMPSDGRVLVVRALGARGDAAACPAVTKAAASSDETVRIAAMEALGSVGGASSVALLTKTAASAGGSEQAAARNSLLRLKANGADAALIKCVAAGEAKVRIEAIRALRRRGAKRAVSTLFKSARDKDSGIRREAIAALGVLAGKKDLMPLVALLVRPADPGDRGAIEQAVGTAFLSAKDPQACTAAVLTPMRGAPADARPSLVRLLGRAGGPKALAAVRTSLKDRDESVKDTAIRTLADWPDASPADEVFALAKSSGKKYRVLLLRGYVRMAGIAKDSGGMCIKAMGLAQSTGDKKLVLSGLGSASTLDAFKLAEKYLDDKATREEAALAATMIAEKLPNSDRVQVRDAMKKIASTVKNRRTRDRANRILRSIPK